MCTYVQELIKRIDADCIDTVLSDHMFVSKLLALSMSEIYV